MLIELETSSILTRLFELPKELAKTIINLSNVNYAYLNKKYATVYLVSGHSFYTTIEGYEKIKTAGQPTYIVPFSSKDEEIICHLFNGINLIRGSND